MNARDKKYTVAIADDHTLMRTALAKLIGTLDDFGVLFEASNGMEVQKLITTQRVIPDILMLDINMPQMDGYATATWIRKHYPQIKVLALSMHGHEDVIIRMLRAGAKGYLMKSVEPDEMRMALYSIIKKDFYLPEAISGKVISGLQDDQQKDVILAVQLTEREKQYLQYLCSDLSYKEIAAKMFISLRTVDEYKSTLADKLGVKTRIGLVVYALKNNLVDV
jgi:two-component system, NarL family, invasion response regulator UvrY